MENSSVPETEGIWSIHTGQASVHSSSADPFAQTGIEQLTYNNPWNYKIERVWYNGRIVYAIEAGEVTPSSADKVAQEYQPVYNVRLTQQGKLVSAVRVPGQLNIYDSVPNQPKYSPIWQFNYVIVPPDYKANSLRSEAACRQSNYRIIKSKQYEN